MKAVLRAMVNIGVSYSDKENQVRIHFPLYLGFHMVCFPMLYKLPLPIKNHTIYKNPGQFVNGYFNVQVTRFQIFCVFLLEIQWKPCHSSIN